MKIQLNKVSSALQRSRSHFTLMSSVLLAMLAAPAIAKDIGKLPENNIAEAFQRIAGVSISSDFGVGTSVSIRGLPKNRVQINGGLLFS